MAAGDKQLGKYVLKSQLGQGGMGVVYLATDTRLKRDVALKILPRQMASSPVAVSRFFQEARVVARLNHPNVVVVHDADQDRGYCYLVMELLTGGTMQERMAQGPLSWHDATSVIAQACRGLAAAQDAGLIHRDIKPSNIMCTSDGAVKLTDFGLAKITDEAPSTDPLTKSNTILGTPQYMSPEQCRGEPLDVRSDVYSLGATYFALLTGAPPFADPQPLQVMFSHCSKPTPDPRSLRSDIPDGCANIVLRAMSKSRADRFASAREMHTALNKLLTSLPTVAIQDARQLAGPPTRRDDLAPTITLAAKSIPEGQTAATLQRKMTAFLEMARGTLDRVLIPRPGVQPPIPGDRANTGMTRGRKIAAVAGVLCLLLLLSLVAWFRSRPVVAPVLVKQAITLEFAGELAGVDAAVRSVVFSADGKSLFAGSMDGGVRQWDIAGRNLLRSLNGTTQPIHAVAANQQWLAAGGQAKTVWLWNLGAKSPPIALADFNGEISTLAFRPDGKRLAVGTYSEVRLYAIDGADVRLLKVLGTSTTPPANCYMVMSVSFSPDNRWLAATSWADRKVIVWDATTGELRGLQDRQADDPMAVAFVPGQDHLLFGMHHRGLVLWDAAKRNLRPVVGSDHTDVRAIAVMPDGRNAIIVGEWDGPVRVYDLEGARAPKIITKATGASALSVAISPNARHVATAGGEQGQRRGYIHLWKVAAEKAR